MDLTVGTSPRSLARYFSRPPFPSRRPHPAKPSVFKILYYPSPNYRRQSFICYSNKRYSYTESVPKELLLKEQKESEVRKEGIRVEEGFEDETADFIDDLGLDLQESDGIEFVDEFLDDDDDDDKESHVGDGGGGGGISLAGTWWDKEALAMAAEVSLSFNGDLKIYAFKTLANSIIRLRIEKMSNKYGSPTMDDIEAFSSAYRLRLDEAEVAGTIPKDISLEVSSPGVERIVRVPEELERFKDRPMYVKYTAMDTETNAIKEADGVFSLISFDLETSHCIWGIANVKLNREMAGKGRPLSKKQREWRLHTPFESLRIVRLHSDS